MAKRKRLDIDYSYDFELYGIISTLKPYKLAWEINRAMSKSLAKMADFEITDKANTMALYTHYAKANEINTLRLFRNKPNEESGSRELLVPEHSHFDFILLAQGEAFEDSNRLQQLLRNIPSVELVAFIPLAALKSKEHFIF
ncbi:MAG: IPExxxVDY family protein [Bacteroidetes bacterium]|nr:IPExxxVDY family protein [Bacteroidota bacterium]MBS1540866.1 IPExxxVDY family protein [Bacteroidota bacterium]